MSRRYLLSRPRTKMYDYNYTMGERLYRPMMDSLDNRPPRGTTSSVAEPVLTSSVSSPRGRSVGAGSDNGEDDVSATIRRIRASRAAMEEETRALEETQVSRRAAVKQRFDYSNRLMDSVGLKTNEKDEFTVRKPRRAVSELEDDSFFKKRTFATDNSEDSSSMTRWSKVGARNGALNGNSRNEEDDFDTAAATARAKQSRARIAEIENEMEELAQRSKARSARRAAAGAVLAEVADMDDMTSSSSTAVSKSVRVKRTTFSSAM